MKAGKSGAIVVGLLVLIFGETAFANGNYTAVPSQPQLEKVLNHEDWVEKHFSAKRIPWWRYPDSFNQIPLPGIKVLPQK